MLLIHGNWLTTTIFLSKGAGLVSISLVKMIALFENSLKIAPISAIINPPLIIGMQDAIRSTSPLTGCSSLRGSGSVTTARSTPRVVSESSSRSTESGYMDLNGVIHIAYITTRQ